MEKTILIAVNFVAYLLFINKCFTLMENMLYGKQYGLLFRMFIGILNAGLMVTMALTIPINIGYLVTLLFLYTELLLIFRKSLNETFFVTVAVMMSIMCLRGIVISLVALALNETLYEVCSNTNLFLGVLVASNTLGLLAVYVILHFMSMENLRFTMQNKTQSRYIIIWASLCVLFMFRSSVVYVRDYSIPNMFIDHLSFCFMLLLSFYYLLIYTFRLNRSAKIRETNKNLSRELGNQIKLQSALTRDAIFTTKANLTQNKVICGLDYYDEFLEQIHYDYDVWFEYAKLNVQQEYRDIYFKSLERQSLVNSFNKGIEPKPFEYRRIGSDNWIRLVLRMFKDVESDDVYVFGYGFDINNEVRDRQALMLGAQTDLFTGLYNKATTETLIGKEVVKGAGIMFLLDIDDFKSVNDSFGHEAGDCVIKYISNLLLSIFRKGDIVGRAGGDEFMIYIKDAANISIAEEKAFEILKGLKTGVDYGNIRIIVSGSIGIAVIDEENHSFSEAYRQADNALYEAKFNGKNGYVIYKKKTGCSAQ